MTNHDFTVIDWIENCTLLHLQQNLQVPDRLHSGGGGSARQAAGDPAAALDKSPQALN
jgi:hypothetical protein